MKYYCARYDEKIYPREAVLKAAYAFIRSVYVHLAHEDGQIIVSFSAKEGHDLPETIDKDFENELLAQTIRLQVYNETHVIREILMARAMSSSMVYKNDPVELFDDQKIGETDEIDSILEDWFKSEK